MRSYEIGEVKKGGEITKTVFISNNPIKSARPGCASCTKVKILEGGNIAITYKAIDSKGTHTKSITLTYEDMTTEKITFKVKVN